VNYYERHIGDYLKDTAHLSLLEHGVYGRLLDVYYTNDAPIPVAKAGRLVGARSPEEIEALAVVLEEFFKLHGDVYTHSRCDREIARYQEKQDKASASASARWGKVRVNPAVGPASDANAMRTQCDRIPNALRSQCEGNALQAPDTSHQTPVSVSACEQAGEQPGPVGPTHTGVEVEQPGAGPNTGPRSVGVQTVAQAMRVAGLLDVSATHPKLQALLTAGMSPEELADAAVYAAKKGQGFAYALATAEARRRDAAELSALPDAPAPAAADPDSRASITADALRLGVGQWRQVDRAGNTVTWAAYAGHVKAARQAERASTAGAGVSP
jgi:uncharacterized protein YdaU (DUF1376 family)